MCLRLQHAEILSKRMNLQILLLHFLPIRRLHQREAKFLLSSSEQPLLWLQQHLQCDSALPFGFFKGLLERLLWS